jgi:hypothetical protein
MTTLFAKLALVLATGLAFSSCADTSEPKPAGPASETSQIPWNTPIPGQGQGAFGAMPQNQFRR